MSSALRNQAGASPESALRACAEALRRVADSRLPPAVDRRLLWLSENKEKLGPPEREELLALIAFAEERTLDKLGARAALKHLGEVWPDLLAPRVMSLISSELRAAVVARAGDRCEYCRLA